MYSSFICLYTYTKDMYTGLFEVLCIYILYLLNLFYMYLILISHMIVVTLMILVQYIFLLKMLLYPSVKSINNVSCYYYYL